MAPKPSDIQEALNIFEAKATIDKDWWKMHKITAWEESKATSKADVIRRAILKGKRSSLSHMNGLVSSQELRIGERVSKVERKFGKDWWYCERRLWDSTLHARSKVFQRLIWRWQKSWTLYPTVLDRQVMPWAHTHRSKWKTHQNLFIFLRKTVQRFGSDRKKGDHNIRTQSMTQWHRCSAVLFLLDSHGQENVRKFWFKKDWVLPPS